MIAYRPLASLLLATAFTLSGCGATPTTAPKATRGRLAAPAPNAQTALPPAGAAEPRALQLVAAVAQAHQTASQADTVIKISYVKSDGTKSWLRSHHQFQKPNRNAITLIAGSDAKVEGTKIVWTGGDKVKVHTKFIGFWITAPLDFSDERLKDPCGWNLEENGVNQAFKVLLDPQNRLHFLGDGNLKGKPMSVLEVQSPSSLPGITKEIFGIDPATNLPILHDIFKGEKLIYHMEMENSKANPSLTSADFEV